MVKGTRKKAKKREKNSIAPDYVDKLYNEDCLTVLQEMPANSIDMVITSPPYWALRDYGVEGQLGLEPTFQEYINKLCDIFDEVKRVLKKEGTCWVNIGDTYSNRGSTSAPKIWRTTPNKVFTTKRKVEIMHKSLVQIPSRFAIEMINRGWILRNEIIWYKPNAMPSSAKDRFTVDFEKIFFFVKNRKYYFEQQFEHHLTQENRPDGIVRNSEYGYNSKVNRLNRKKYTVREKRGGNKNPYYLNSKGRNKRCVWKISTQPFKEAHFAVYPAGLIETPIRAGCPKGGVVLDPFMGSGTTWVVAKKLNRKFIGIDLNNDFIEIAKTRIKNVGSSLF